MTAVDVYAFNTQTSDGKAQPLAAYKGKVLLIVNTASQCGFTPQFKGLQQLYERYQSDGLVVLGFPSNEFGHQDPGSNAEIVTFCQHNYGVTFPMMAKIEVNGAGADPLYQWLKSSKPGVLGSEAIKWNFTKFLLDRSGQVRSRHAPQTAPEQLEAEIQLLLAEPAPLG